MKPRDQKEVDSDDTANDLPIQDKSDERETHGSRGSGLDGRIQSRNWAARADGLTSSGTWEQSGF